MAVAFWVDHPEGFGSVFAAHDEYLSVFTYFNNGKEKPDVPLSPEDNYYTAPYCFMPKKRDKRFTGGFVVFTCQVPWVAGNGKSEEELKVHNMAKDWMEKKGTHKAPHVGSVERFQDDLGLGEEELYCFTVDGCYPSKEDVCQGLEDKAVEVTCAAMNWRIPTDWRNDRAQKESNHSMPLLNLADWDKAQQKRSSSGSKSQKVKTDINSQIKKKCKLKNDGDGVQKENGSGAREAKKDSSSEIYLC